MVVPPRFRTDLRQDRSSVFLCVFAFAPSHPCGSGDTQRSVHTAEHAHHQGEGKGEDAVQTVQLGDDAHHTQSHHRSDGGDDGPAGRLVDGMVDQLFEAGLLAQQAAVLTDTVVDDDGIVDGVAEDGEHGGDEVAVQGGTQQHEGAKHHHQVVHQCQHCHHAAGEAADVLKAQGNIQQDQHQREHHGHKALLQELGAHGRADIAQRQLRKAVVRVALVQAVQQVGHLFRVQGVLTGKGQEFGGSLIRPEATGYGNVYFLCNMLATKNIDIKGKTVLVSGSGNVAQYTMEKLLQLGAKPVTCSDSDGYIYDPDGIDREKLDYIMELKNVERGRIKEYAEKYGVKYVAGAKPWFEKADIALPSATQNEINEEAAKALVANGVIAVSEGANMPTTPEAIKVFQDAKILYSPGKAANAGGVAVSGLEMSQNSERLKWSREEVDAKLHDIMNDIHANCVKYGTEPDGYINYVKGANVAGFLKVAKAMMAQGIV